MEEIWSINWDSVIPMPDYIERMIDICHQIVEGKGTMDDMMLTYAIFHSLSNDNVEWNVLKMSLIKKKVKPYSVSSNNKLEWPL